jgi:predicted Zn finger-like uncharacterized protein
MKIVCDNCATKYSIADEKVRGKVFKIRCKKCSHVIVVKGGEGGQSEIMPGDPSAYDGEDATAMATAAPSGEGVWHLVIDREQVGPMTPEEIRAKVAAGQADADTYAWREGFGDWVRLGSIDEFRDLDNAGAVPAAAAMTIGTNGTDEVHPQAAVAAVASMSSSNDDFFSAPASFPGMSGGKDQVAAERPGAFGFDAGNGASSSSSKLTGQRNESSVLFSLNNLQGLATQSTKPAASAPRPGGGMAAAGPTPAASGNTEGSGLIDIRAMAQQTIGAPGGPAATSSTEPPIVSAAPVISSMMAAPILMPAQQTGTPKWIWGVVGVGVLLVGGIVASLVVLLTRKPETVTVQQPVGPQPTAVAANTGQPQPAATGTPVAGAGITGTPAANTAAGTATGDKGSEKAGSRSGKSDKGSKSSSGSTKPGDKGSKGGDALAAATAPPVSTTPAPSSSKSSGSTKPSKGGDTTLDDLLDGATGGSSKTSSRKPAQEDSGGGGNDANLPDQLSRDDIKKGMGAAQSRAKTCFQQFHVPGTVLVNVIIGGSGKVQNAEVKSSFAGTPTGDCVAKAVKNASFGRFKGSPMSVTYPIVLP